MTLAEMEKTLRKLCAAPFGMAAAFSKSDLVNVGVTDATIKSWTTKYRITAEWDLYTCNLICKNSRSGVQEVTKAFGY